MKGLGRLAAPGLATLAAVIILCGLGVWQVQRLAWKEALIASVDSRLKSTPMQAPGPARWRNLDLEEAEYTPVELTGRFDYAREIFVFTSLSQPQGKFGGLGYLVFTPLVTDQGWAVFINRGFVPSDRKSPSSRSEGQVPGVVKVAGLLRQPEQRQWYSPRDSAKDNIWYTRDLAAFTAASDLPPSRIAPFFIDAFADPTLPGGLPEGGETIVSFPNNHLGYAITWFGLAVAAFGVFLVFARGRLRDDRVAAGTEGSRAPSRG